MTGHDARDVASRRWFAALDPPPGGEARLRRALADGRDARRWPRRPSWRLALAGSAVACVLVLATFVALQPTRVPPGADVRRALELASGDAARADVGALREHASADARVRIYLVAPMLVRESPGQPGSGDGIRPGA